MRTLSSTRLHFLAGAGGLIAASACSPTGVGTALFSRQPMSIPDLLKATGFTFATDPVTKVTTYATGYSSPAAPTNGHSVSDCMNYADNQRGVRDVCNPDVPPDPATEGAFEVQFPIIGQTSTVVSPPVQVASPQPFVFAAFGAWGGTWSPTYGLAPFKMTACLSQINGFAAAAWSAAQYISANASQYTQAIVNSAKAAVARWGGTGMGISAAATFVYGLVASLGAAEWLSLALAIGITGTAAYIVLNCIYNGIYA